MSSFCITTCKLVWIYLCSYSIYTDSEVMVCNSSISRFNTPKRFRQRVDCSRRIENNFSSVESKSHPMKRMMSAVTDVYGYFTKLSLENWVTSLSFHIVSRLVEITYPWDVSFFLFAKYFAIVINDYCCIVEGFFVLFSFQNGRNNHHVMLPGQFLQKLGWLTVNRFCELYPGISFTCTHEERSCPYFL